MRVPAGAVARALAAGLGRAVLPTAALALANVAVGRTLARSAALTVRETAAVRGLQARRGPVVDAAARVVSTAADVPASVLHGLVAVAVLARRRPPGADPPPRTRQGGHLSGAVTAERPTYGGGADAALPALALVVETAAYLVAGAVVQRARPDVPRLDRDQPTSSFPSGHQGATVALLACYLHLARGARPHPALTALAVAWPAALAWARVHTGLHYPSDVVAGTLNGLASALIAERALRS